MQPANGAAQQRGRKFTGFYVESERENSVVVGNPGIVTKTPTN